MITVIVAAACFVFGFCSGVLIGLVLEIETTDGERED